MLKGYRTLIFGFLISALGANQASDVATIVPDEWVGVVMAAIGVVVLALRSLTDTAVARSG
ncbi:MAG: hypothetical protein AB7U38_01810 [Hyphomicrobiales bacterium]